MAFEIHANTPQARKARAMLNALIDIAQDPEATYDFFVSKMIWGVSLYLESGDYKENWKSRIRASDAALKLREESPDWKKHVTFEHSRTLYDTFNMLRNNGSPISLEQAAGIISEYPPVLITKKENERITKLGFKKSGAPETRYKEIEITTFELRAL